MSKFGQIILPVFVIVGWLAIQAREPDHDQRVPDAANADLGAANQLLDAVPLAFVPNTGQWPGDCRYEARCGAMTAFLEAQGWMLSLVEKVPTPVDPRSPLRQALEPVRGAAVRMRFVGANAADLIAGERLAGVHNYFLGNDPTRWRTDVPRHAAVRYRGLYPGVEVRAYGKGAHFEYDLMLQPSADLARVEIEVQGAQGLHLDRDGALVIDTAVGRVQQPRPVTFVIEGSGERRSISCDYELRGASSFGFVASDWRGEVELVLDPGLLYSTRVGGPGPNDPDYARALAVDQAGVVTLTGETYSQSYPTTPGAWQQVSGQGGRDAHVTRLDPSQPQSQQLVYATFLGGSGSELSNAIAVDGAGVVTIAGETESTNFPTTSGAFSSTHGNFSDVFVARLDPSRSQAQQLLYSTFVGGSAFERAHALAVDAAGVTTIAGYTSSANYPTTPGAWDTTHNGGQDVFVTRLDPSLLQAQQLVYSTFVGGANLDSALALAVDTSGVVTVAGSTSSPNYPTTPGVWNTTHNGGSVNNHSDAFVTRLNPSLPQAQQLVYSTFVGGVGDDDAGAIAIDGTGVVTIAGLTGSANYPTTLGAHDTALGGALDAFVTRLDSSLPSMQQLVYSTFVGGSGNDVARALAVDAAGVVTIAGNTDSIDYPTTPGAWDTTHTGGSPTDAFVTRLDPIRTQAQQLQYSTFLGGSGGDAAWAIVVETTGRVTIAGNTDSIDYPTTPGAWGTVPSMTVDAVVTRLDMLPTGVTAIGRSTSGCRGVLPLSVLAMPSLGNANFVFTCSNAPPNGLGVFALSRGVLQTPQLLVGTELWIDPATFVVSVAGQADARGVADLPAPVPSNAGLLGLSFGLQSFWLEAVSPSPCPPLGWSASNALLVTIQP